jgi:hypothetical protein
LQEGVHHAASPVRHTARRSRPVPGIPGSRFRRTATNTNTEKGLVETFVDVVNACDPGGEPYLITTTSNVIEHETVFDDGRAHFTFTQNGKVVAAPLDGTGPRYTGHYTVWGGFNQNGEVVSNGTFTFNLALKGSDGSKYTEHSLDHFNVRPDGTENFFSHCNN